MASQVLIEAAGHLRDLRRSYGYETAASFARAIGYKPDTYRRYERRFPNQCNVFMRLCDAIENVGPVSLDWLCFGGPEWAGPLFARAGLRVRNGVSAQKVIDEYRRDMTPARLRHEERQAREG